LKKNFLEYILEGERDVSEMKMRFRRSILYDSRPRFIRGPGGTAAPLATPLCEAFERDVCLANPLSLLA
jgi:hypothetical protein